MGTLTNVLVTLQFGTLQGEFTVTNTDTSDASVVSYDSMLTIRQNPINSLGYNTYSSTIFDVTTIPDWTSTIIAGNGGVQVFDIGTALNFATNVQTINSTNFPSYKSIGGTGTVALQARNIQIITTSGSGYSLNSGTAGADIILSVDYYYLLAPIPEPSTYAMIIFGGLIMLFVKCKKTLLLRRDSE